MKSLARSALFLIVLLPFHLNAGWIITGRYINQEGKTIRKRYFIQDHNVKVEQFNLIYSCNLKTGNIILVDPVNLVFVKTSFKAYAEKTKAIRTGRLNELLLVIPEDQRADWGKLYRAQIDRELLLPAYGDDSLSLTPVPDSSKLLGYPTLKFEVDEKGYKKEELFLTKEVNLSADLDMKTFLPYVYLLEPDDKTVAYRSSGKYSSIADQGLVLRRFIFQQGFRTEWQVNKIEQKNIPEYEFGTPDLCKELTLDKWLAREKNTDDNYYDDYE